MALRKPSKAKQSPKSLFQELISIVATQLAAEDTNPTTYTTLSLFDPTSKTNITSQLKHNNDNLLFARELILSPLAPQLLVKLECKLAQAALSSTQPHISPLESLLVNWAILLLPKATWQSLEGSIPHFSRLFIDTLEKLPFPTVLQLILKDLADSKVDKQLLTASEFLSTHRAWASAPTQERKRLILTLFALSPYYLLRYLEAHPHAAPYAPTKTNSLHFSTLKTSLHGGDYRWDFSYKLHPAVYRTFSACTYTPPLLLRQFPSKDALNLPLKQYLQHLFFAPYLSNIEDIITYCTNNPKATLKCERVLRASSLYHPSKYLQFCTHFNLPQLGLSLKQVYRAYKTNSGYYTTNENLDAYCEHWLENATTPLDLKVLLESKPYILRQFLHKYPSSYPIASLAVSPHNCPWLFHPHALSYLNSLSKADFAEKYISIASDLHRHLSPRDHHYTYNSTNKEPPPALSRKEALTLLEALTERKKAFKYNPPFDPRWDHVDSAIAADSTLSQDAADFWLSNSLSKLTSDPNATNPDTSLVLKSYSKKQNY